MRGQAQIVADKDECAAVCPRFGEQQVDKGDLARGIEGRGRLVGDEDFRLSDEGAGSSDALLLANRERVRRPVVQARRNVEVLKQGLRLRLGITRLRRSSRGKTARQEHVVAYRQVGNEVELLENEADVVGAKSVAPRRRQRGEGLAEQLDTAGLRRQHATNKVEQRALAAAARPLQKQAVFGVHR